MRSAVNQRLTAEAPALCPACGYRLDAVLVELGLGYHPCCTPGVDCRTAAEVKADATRIYRAALRRGEITPADACERCGAWPEGRALDGHHHRGYSAPLDVIFLCPRCHRLAHRETP